MTKLYLASKILFLIGLLAPTGLLAAKEKKALTGAKPQILIDPGHGGEDEGTHSISPPIYHEKNINLSTARLIEEYLKSQQVTTCLTRTGDETLSLESRINKTKNLQPKIFVSVHYNAALSSSAHGIEVFYYQSDKDKTLSKKSKELAELVLSEVIQSTDAKSRGVKHGNYAVIREASMPAILVECGFMTNANEMNKIKSPQYLKKVATGISKGIVTYLDQTLKSDKPK